MSRRRPPVVTPAALPAFTSPSMRRRISDRHSSFCPQISPDSATKAQEGISEWLGKKRPRYISATRLTREFFVGNKRSILDAYAFPMVHWAEATLADGLSALPNIRAHHQRTAIDPAVQRVLAAEA